MREGDALLGTDGRRRGRSARKGRRRGRSARGGRRRARSARGSTAAGLLGERRTAAGSPGEGRTADGGGVAPRGSDRRPTVLLPTTIHVEEVLLGSLGPLDGLRKAENARVHKLQ